MVAHLPCKSKALGSISNTARQRMRIGARETHPYTHTQTHTPYTYAINMHNIHAHHIHNTHTQVGGRLPLTIRDTAMAHSDDPHLAIQLYFKESTGKVCPAVQGIQLGFVSIVECSLFELPPACLPVHLSGLPIHPCSCSSIRTQPCPFYSTARSAL